jgi:hypothetical protein
VPIGVVDLLEMIDVKHGNRDRGVIADCAGDFPGGFTLPGGGVEQAVLASVREALTNRIVPRCHRVGTLPGRRD